MKGGSLLCWRAVVGVVGSTSPGVALRPWASVGCWESGAEWPCSVGIRRERVEAVGAAGRTTWTAVVGLADETSARRGFCGVSLGRSSRRQPFTTACPGGDALPQGGGAAPNGCVAERQSEKLGACQLWKENHRGVKIIRAQHYAGVDNHGASPSCPCTSRRHRTSRADAGATSTASLWSGHGNRAGKEREPGGKNEVVLACGRKFCLEVESP